MVRRNQTQKTVLPLPYDAFVCLRSYSCPRGDTYIRTSRLFSDELESCQGRSNAATVGTNSFRHFVYLGASFS